MGGRQVEVMGGLSPQSTGDPGGNLGGTWGTSKVSCSQVMGLSEGCVEMKCQFSPRDKKNEVIKEKSDWFLQFEVADNGKQCTYDDHGPGPEHVFSHDENEDGNDGDDKDQWGGDSESQPFTHASRQGQDDHFNRHHHHPHQDHGLVF